MFKPVAIYHRLDCNQPLSGRNAWKTGTGKVDGKMSVDELPVISVIIPSYNSSRYIRRCLQALLAQDTQVPFEIILVDSSEDGADGIVAAEFPQVHLFHFNERRAVGTARNIGIEHARGDLILFVDTDCIAAPDWISRIHDAFTTLNADGVGGSLKNGTPKSMSGSIGYYLEFFRVLPGGNRPCEMPFLVGANCGFKRSVFELARYPDRMPADDWIFNLELVRQGKKLFFLPGAVVTHLNKTGLAKVLRYQYKLGAGACMYRSDYFPETLRPFRVLPLLSFLIPAFILPRIGATVLKRGGFLEFAKYLGLLPVLWIANTVWAAGFYREIKDSRAKPRSG